VGNIKMEISFSVSFTVKRKPHPTDVYNLREITRAIASYYSFKNIGDIVANLYRDDVDNTWEISLSSETKVPEKFLEKIISSIDFRQLLGYVLLSRSILVYMTSVIRKRDDVMILYNSWGVITKREPIRTMDMEVFPLSYDEINTIQNEVDNSLSSRYTYFITSPAVLAMADKYKLYHTTFNEYTILKRAGHTKDDLIKMISEFI
jgi:hypothetical protein